MLSGKPWLILAGLVCLLPVPCHTRPDDRAQDSRKAESERILKGLRGVQVVVEDLRPPAQEAGLTKQGLQTDVESRLRRAGVRVLTEAPRGPHLLLNANVVRASLVGYYGWAIDLELKEPVRLERDPERTVWAVTWRPPSYRFGAASKSRLKGRVQQVVAELADLFCSEYLAANSRAASAGTIRERRGSAGI